MAQKRERGSDDDENDLSKGKQAAGLRRSEPLSDRPALAARDPQPKDERGEMYFAQLQEKFKDDTTGKFNKFARVLDDFTAQKMNIKVMVERVTELLKGERELIVGFNTFLPEGYKITLPPEVEGIHQQTQPVIYDVSHYLAMEYITKIKKRFTVMNEEHVYEQFMEIMKMLCMNKNWTQVSQAVETLFQDHHGDLVQEFKNFVPEANSITAPPPVAKPEIQLQVQPALKLRDAVTRRHAQADKRGGVDHQAIISSEPSYDKRAGKRPLECPIVIDKVKARLRNGDTYQEFLKCLHIFSLEIISRRELQNLVGDILGKHPDLMEEFNALLTHTGKKEEGNLAGRTVGYSHEALLKAGKADQKDSDKEKTNHREIKDKGKDKVVEGEYTSKAAKSQSTTIVPLNRISMLELSKCKKCTRSYWLLPEKYAKPMHSSYRTSLGDSVLNDRWVSRMRWLEHTRPEDIDDQENIEKILDKREDDRFELDMLKERTSATSKVLEKYMGNLSTNLGRPLIISALNLGCIKEMYKKEEDVSVYRMIMEALQKRSSQVVPLILFQLRRKQERFTKERKAMNKDPDHYERDFCMALGHRSFKLAAKFLQRLY